MNQGGQGQQPQGTPQAQAQQLASQQAQQLAAQRAGPQITLYRAEQMRNIGLLTEDEKVKYERGLQQLWTLHDSKPAGSPENMDAKKKLVEFGKMLQSKLTGRRQQMLQQQQRAAQQAQQGQGQGQQQQGQQPGQQPPQQTQQNANAQPHAGNQQTPQQQPVQLPGTAPAGNAQQQGASSTSAPQGPRPGVPQPKIPDHIMQHVNQMNFQAPANEPDKVKWASEMKLKYTRALLTMESSRANLARLEHMIKDRNDKGNPFTPEEQNNYNARKEQLQKSYQEGHNFVERTRQQLGINKNAAQQQQNGGNQGPKPGPNQQQPPVTPRMQQPGGQAAGAGANPMQNSAATVNAAIEAAKNQQLAAARMAGQQGQQSLPQSQIVPPSTQPQVQPSPVPHQTPQVQAQPGQQQQQPSQPQNQNQNQNLSQSQTHQQQQQQPHIKPEPGTHPHPNLPAPLNTALASAAAASGLPSAGTPTQNSARSALQTPQTATSTTAAGQPRPLTHSAALNIANQRTGSIAVPGQQQPGGQTGTPTQSTPGTGSGVIGAAQQQQHPHQFPQQHPGHAQPGQQALQSKLPIPKVLPEKATQVPAPVPVMGGIGTGRPTYSGGSGIGGGVMSQPALAKTPGYQLEGDGDRVLNKKKLDELVRQVCGGTAEGDESSLLTPDVEEVRSPFLLFTHPNIIIYNRVSHIANIV